MNVIGKIIVLLSGTACATGVYKTIGENGWEGFLWGTLGLICGCMAGLLINAFIGEPLTDLVNWLTDWTSKRFAKLKFSPQTPTVSLSRWWWIGAAIVAPIIILLIIRIFSQIAVWSFGHVENTLIGKREAWILVGICLLILVAKLIQGGIKLPAIGETTGKLKTGLGLITAQCSKFLIPFLVLAAVAVYTWNDKFAWKDSSGISHTPLDWAWKHRAFSLTIVGLIIWFALRHKNFGHSSHGHWPGWLEAAKSLLLLSITIFILTVCWNFGGWIWKEAGGEPAIERAAPQPPPPPQIDPRSIRMGTWLIIIPPGESSEWIDFCRHTKVKRSSTTLIQKGKRVGEKIVPSPNPLQRIEPNENPGFYDDEAARYYAIDQPLTLTVTRTWN